MKLRTPQEQRAYDEGRRAMWCDIIFLAVLGAWALAVIAVVGAVGAVIVLFD